MNYFNGLSLRMKLIKLALISVVSLGSSLALAGEKAAPSEPGHDVVGHREREIHKFPMKADEFHQKAVQRLRKHDARFEERLNKSSMTPEQKSKAREHWAHKKAQLEKLEKQATSDGVVTRMKRAN